MKNRHPFAVRFGAAFLLLLLISESAFAFRCGQKIVIEKMHELEVRKICGEPSTERQLGVVLRGVAIPHRSGSLSGVRVERYPGSYYTEEVLLTEYVYNFGPRKFMRRLLFEGGVLVKIESIGYGFREKKSK